MMELLNPGFGDIRPVFETEFRDMTSEIEGLSGSITTSSPISATSPLGDRSGFHLGQFTGYRLPTFCFFLFLLKRRDELADLPGDQRLEFRIFIENHLCDDGHHHEMRRMITPALEKAGDV